MNQRDISLDGKKFNCGVRGLEKFGHGIRLGDTLIARWVGEDLINFEAFPAAAFPRWWFFEEGKAIPYPYPTVDIWDIKKLEQTPLGPVFMPQTDPVNHPSHYTSHPSGVECIQITEHMGFNLGNAVKYIWRADLKADVIQDLEKAKWYLEREIQKRKTGKK
jgi:hypothetical protein